MATSKADPMVSAITKYIEDGIRKEARKIADNYKEQIIKDVEDAMSDIVARMSTRLMKHYSVQDMKDHIVIEVRKEFVTPPKERR